MMTRIVAMTSAALFVSLAAAGTASAQGSVADPVPLLFGTEKAKTLYSIPYVRANANVATCVSCTSTDKSTASFLHYVAFEAFWDGSPENDLTLGEGVAELNYGGDSEAMCTLQPASFTGTTTTLGVAAENISLGSGRVVATTTKVICSAFLVPVVGDPPGFMTILPMYKGSKQKGGM